MEQQDPHSLATYLENHNAYVEQIHNINGMIDQYYGGGLPNLLQVRKFEFLSKSSEL